MKHIEILSRNKAKSFSAMKNIPSCVIVSINSDDGIPNRFFNNPQIKAVTHFTFNDVEDGNDSITEEQVNQISDFVKRWIDKVDTIVVHCDAGVSRSAGIGAAIMKWANGDDSKVFNDGTFCPNMRCYRLMLNALMIDMTDEEINEKFNRNIEAWKQVNDID